MARRDILLRYKFGRYWCTADIEQAATIKLDLLVGTLARRGPSIIHRRLWNTGSPAGACHRRRDAPTRWRAMTTEGGGGACYVVRPSLRATGSRECAPDDRLREAIHGQENSENGLLRRFARRNDHGG
jgi:hypothetical protein